VILIHLLFFLKGASLANELKFSNLPTYFKLPEVYRTFKEERILASLSVVKLFNLQYQDGYDIVLQKKDFDMKLKK
jgi:hypothetical protein